jgi:hypothetical protein
LKGKKQDERLMSNDSKTPENFDDPPHVLRLSRRDAETSAQALISPPKPSARLIEAARRYLAARQQESADGL